MRDHIIVGLHHETKVTQIMIVQHHKGSQDDWSTS